MSFWSPTIEALLEGNSVLQTVQIITEKFPATPPGDLFNAATEHLRRIAVSAREPALGWLLEVNRTIYERALRVNDLATCLKAAHEIASLIKLMPTQADIDERRKAAQEANTNV